MSSPMPDVARRATVWDMGVQAEVSQRDLRMRSKEIMDAVEHGESFTVTRDGHGIGELVPLRRKSVFVLRETFVAARHAVPSFDLDGFRADQRAAFDQDQDDPFAR